MIQPSDIGMPISCPGCRGIQHVELDTGTYGLELRAGAGEERTDLAPWERATTLGFGRRIANTFLEVLLRPGLFFRRFAPTDLDSALHFACIAVSIGVLPHVARLICLAVVERGPGASDRSWAWFIALLTGVPLFFFICVLASMVAVFVASLVSHLVLTLTGGARLELEATGRIYAYAMAPYATGVFLYACAFYGLALVVPRGGALWLWLNPAWGFVAGLSWMTFVVMIGLREVQHVSTWRAILAAVAPIALALFCLAGPLVGL